MDDPMTETNSPPDVAEEPVTADADRAASLGAPRSIGDLWRMLAKLSTGTIARGAIWGLLITGGGVALGMLSQVALARQLGTAGFGVYLYVMAAMNALSIIARLELD
jgi:hypothetical protein